MAARVKTYTEAELAAIRSSKGASWLMPSSPGAFLTESGNLYALLEADDPDRAHWLHAKEGLVNLANVNRTGEVRWTVEPSRVEADDMAAVLHYGLTPADMSPSDWRDVVKAQKFKLADLSTDEQELIRRSDAQGHGKVSQPPDQGSLRNAIWDAMHKGLVYLEGEASGGGGGKASFYCLTPKGRKLKAAGNPERHKSPTNGRRRRRAKNLRERSRSDRLRRLLRGV